MFSQDDEHADRWDYESDRYLDVFENFLLRFSDEEYPDWDLGDEPDEIFMEISDRNAQELLIELEGGVY